MNINKSIFEIIKEEAIKLYKISFPDDNLIVPPSYQKVTDFARDNMKQLIKNARKSNERFFNEILADPKLMKTLVKWIWMEFD